VARSRDDDFIDDPPRRRREEGYDDEDDRPRRKRRRDDDEEDLPRVNRAYLREVAWLQKAVMLCLLAYVAAIPVSIALNALPPNLQLLGSVVLGLYALVVLLTAAVFVFMMALKVYSTGVGVLLGLLTLIPCVGLIVLLVINSKATGVLKQNGVRVGLFGANSSDL
jgi:hypothetical protein